MRLLLRNEYISIFVLNKKCKNYSKNIGGISQAY